MEPSSGDSFSSKVSLNMLTNIIRTLVVAVTGLLLVPYYISELGMASYAILPLATSVTVYVMMASEGLADAFTRYLIIAIQGKNEHEANVTYSSSVIGVGKAVLILSPAVLILSLLSPYVFNIGPSAAMDVQIMFLLILASSLLVSFTTCFNSIFMAYNKLYLMYGIRTAHCLLQVILVIFFFVSEGPSLIFIGVSYFIAAVVLVVLLLFFVRRVAPFLKIRRSYYNRDRLREMSGLGMWAMLTRLGTLLFIQASLIVVNICLGSEMEGNFSVVANIISISNTACMSITAVVVPLVYRCYSEGDSVGLLNTLKIFTKFIGLMMAFPLAYICIFAPQILTTWLGPGYDSLYGMLYIMIPIQICVCSMDVLESIPILYARVRVVATTTLLLGVMNVVCSVMLISFTDVGVLGVCSVWAVSMILLRAVFYPLYTSRLIKCDRKMFFKPMFQSYAMFASISAVGILSTYVYTLPSTWFSILSSFGVLFLLYLILILTFCLNRDEKKLVLTYLPVFLQKLIINRTKPQIDK